MSAYIKDLLLRLIQYLVQSLPVHWLTGGCYPIIWITSVFLILLFVPVATVY